MAAAWNGIQRILRKETTRATTKPMNDYILENFSYDNLMGKMLGQLF